MKIISSHQNLQVRIKGTMLFTLLHARSEWDREAVVYLTLVQIAVISFSEMCVPRKWDSAFH